MRLLLVLLLLPALALRVHAQLGQTVEQCAAAYGKPVAIDGAPDSLTTAYHYKFKDYSIVIYFSKENPVEMSSLPATAAKIIFQRTDKKNLTDEEIRALLVANAEQRQWSNSIPGWQRTDKAVAFGEDANSNPVDSAPIALMMEESYYEVQTIQPVYAKISKDLVIPSTNSAPSQNSNANPAIANAVASSSASSPALPSPQQSASDYNAQGFDKYTKGDFDGAIADFNQAIALDPKLAEAYNRRGNANKAKGNTDKAIADYLQAITVDPNYANPHNNLGIFKVEKGDFDGAIADFTQAIALDPKLAQAYNNRGIAKRDKGDLDGAVTDFKQSVALDPKFAPALPVGYDSTQEEQSFVNLLLKDVPTINEAISSFKLQGDTMVLTMTDKYSNAPYQDRLQFARDIYKRWAEFHNDKSETWVSPLSMIDAGGAQVGGTNGSELWVTSKADQDAQAQRDASQAEQDEAKYADLFKLPPKGGTGRLGGTMRIVATFTAQLTPSIATVRFVSNTIEPYTDSNGTVHAGGIVYDNDIAVMGLPSSFAEGSTWEGMVYPAGTLTWGVEKFHLYATSEQQAIELLKNPPQ